MAKEIIIASVIEATKEWSIKLGDKAKTMTFKYGRNPITEEEFKALKNQKKGFVALLKNGQFSEPESNVVKHNDAMDKVEKKHKDDIEKLKETLVKDKEKAIDGIKSEIGKQKLDFEKKLEKSNDALIDSEKEVKKLKDQVAALKKGK